MGQQTYTCGDLTRRYYKEKQIYSSSQPTICLILYRPDWRSSHFWKRLTKPIRQNHIAILKPAKYQMIQCRMEYLLRGYKSYWQSLRLQTGRNLKYFLQ